MSARKGPPEPTRLPSDREQAIFEAGIKLGGLFHQYIGTPISHRTARGLARTIERAIALQPFVRQVRVELHPEREGPPGKGRFAYGYLTARMIDATVEVGVGRARVVGRLAYRPDLRYPLMHVARSRRRLRAGGEP